jgi:hypothetical protein
MASSRIPTGTTLGRWALFSVSDSPCEVEPDELAAQKL